MRVWNAIAIAAWIGCASTTAGAAGDGASAPSTPGTSHVAPAPVALPTAAVRAYFEGEREAGAERSEPLSRALLWIAARTPEPRRAGLLALAAQADPALTEPHLRRARDAIRHGDVAGVCAAIADAWHALRLDPREEARWMQSGVHALHTLFTATLMTLALLLALRALRLARHALGEALGTTSGATLLLIVPLASAWLVSPAVGTLVLLAAVAPFLRRGECRTLAMLCVALAGLEFGLRFCAPHAMLLDPRTQAAQIAHLNDAGHDAALQRILAGNTRPSSDIELVLGLQARRRGDTAAAQAHFVAALRADSTAAPAYVNLANLFFRAGDYERAATGYRAAEALDPTLAVAYANLAQTYIRVTHYSESDRELRAAAAHGMADIARRRALWRDESEPVFDATLPRATLLRQARDEIRRQPAHREASVQTWRSSPWRGLRPGLSIWLLAAMAGWLLYGPRLRRVAVPCPACGTVLCTHCVAQSPVDDRCNPCQIAAPRSRVPGEEMIAPDRRRRVSLATGRWIAPLFPGAADLVRGASVPAALATACAWCALLIVAHAVDVARLRSDPWYVAADIRVLQIGALMLGFLWLPGLLRLRNRERDSRVMRRTPQPGV